VIDGWQIVLNETSVYFLLGLRARYRQDLLKAFEALVADSMQKGSFEE
jgi:hypothetical protein